MTGEQMPAAPPEADPNDFSELEGKVERADAGLPPAAAKIPVTDPTLSVSSGRRPRKRAIAVAGSLFAGVAAASLFLSGTGRATSRPAKREESVAAAPVPQGLLDAPERLPAVPAADAPARPAAAPSEPVRPAVPAASSAAPDSSHRKALAARKSREEAELLKARGAGILIETGLPPSPPPIHGVDDDDDDDDELEQQGSGRDSVRTVGAASAGEIFADGAGDPNLQERKNRFANGEAPPRTRRRLHRLQHLRSPYTLTPGTIIRAAVQSAINSDLPGPVIARVVENVCDSITGEWLLIPQGATLLAYYDSMVAWGQERVLMCWKDLELPSGDSMDLGCMPAADWAGRAGLHDQVDEHWWRIVKGAAVSSMLTAGMAAAGGNTVGFNPTIPQLLARGAASDIGSVGQAITRRNIMIQPTLEIRQAQPVNVIITEPLDFSSDAPATPCHSRQE